MKAFVYKIENGRPVLPGFIMGPYATRSSFIRYGLGRLKSGEYRVETEYDEETAEGGRSPASEIIDRTHAELSKLAPRTCTASDLTFGGRCLNCGFQPIK